MDLTYSMAVDWNIVFLPYSDNFRAQRKLLNAALNPTAVVDYTQIQEKETYALLDRLLETPDKFYKHVRRSVDFLYTHLAHPLQHQYTGPLDQ